MPRIRNTKGTRLKERSVFWTDMLNQEWIDSLFRRRQDWIKRSLEQTLKRWGINPDINQRPELYKAVGNWSTCSTGEYTFNEVHENLKNQIYGTIDSNNTDTRVMSDDSVDSNVSNNKG